MHLNLSEYVTNTLVKSKEIKESEKEYYLYCINGLFEMGLNLIITILIGVLFGVVLETILFLFIIIPLRSTAGGFHAEKSWVCFIISMSLYISTVALAVHISADLTSILKYIFVISVLIISALSPVDSIHKRLDEITKKQMKLKSIRFIIVDTILFFVLVFFGKYKFCNVIIISFAFVLLFQILGIIKNKLCYK